MAVKLRSGFAENGPTPLGFRLDRHFGFGLCKWKEKKHGFEEREGSGCSILLVNNTVSDRQ